MFVMFSWSLQLIKEDINPFLENSITQNFYIMSYNNLSQLNLNQSEIKFLFDNQEVLPIPGEYSLNITSSMIDNCPNSLTSVSNVFYRNCSIEMINLLQLSDALKFNYIYIYESQSTNYLNLIEHSYSDYLFNPNDTTYVFPNSLYSLMTYAECVTSLCQNSNNTGSISIHDEYNFKINILEEYQQMFEFLLYRVILSNYNQYTNEIQYVWDVTNSISAQNLTYSLPLVNLPNTFDLQIDYIVKAQPGLHINYDSVNIFIKEI